MRIDRSLQLGNGQAGFSLVELLSAIFIMSLAATAVVLAWPEAEPPVRTEALAFERIVKLAGQEAIVSGNAVGLHVSPDAVMVMRRRRGEWIPLSGNEFGRRAWAPSVGVIVELPEPPERSEFSARLSDPGDAGLLSASAPQIVFDSTGGVTPFSIQFSGAGGVYRVLANLNGEVRLAAEDDNARL